MVGSLNLVWKPRYKGRHVQWLAHSAEASTKPSNAEGAGTWICSLN